MLTAFVDQRCRVRTCATRGIYRMVGSCLNCGVENVLMLFTVGHEALGAHVCPICGTRNLRTKRRATEDEIPAAVSGMPMSEPTVESEISHAIH